MTTGQPSTNPRLVKEADALAAHGFDVHVIGAYWSDWATVEDAALMAGKPWRLTFVDWRKERSPRVFHTSRVRHWAAKKMAAFGSSDTVATAALSRVGPELAKAAAAVPADLYIAHNLGALPPACTAAQQHAARVGFDAEDFHSGQLSRPEDAGAAAITRNGERRFLPRCAYVTAAAPGIADAYRDLCGIPEPTCVLNVFPLADRPATAPHPGQGPVRLYWFSQTIGPHRGLEMAVRGLGLLGDPTVELHLRGRWQAGFEAQLRQLAAASGLAASQIVGHEPANPREMIRLASRHDIGLALEPPVNVNNDILLSNKIFTYLLGGTAVVATRTRGQARLLPELGCAAMSCAPEDPASFANALRPWISDRAALDRARQAAWRLGEERYNWDREQQTFLGVVNQTLGRA